ncbi:MAG TPA: hypothetical protein VMO47_01320 [Rhodothermales bacterium]|nr:hypothetical protein [Rhodothermales bacterium]
MALLSIVSACGGNDGGQVSERPYEPSPETSLSPEETVRQLLSAYLDKRLGEYYHLVASIDKEAKSLESLQEEFAPGSSDLVTDYMFRFTTFRIDSTSVADDTAFVYVTAEAPEIGSVMREATVVERSLGPGSDLLTKMSLLNERLRLAGGPRVENQSVHFLVREPKGWRAVVGWAEEKAFEEQMRADSAQAGGT